MEHIGKLFNVRNYGDEMRSKFNNIDYPYFVKEVQDAFFNEVKADKYKGLKKEDVEAFVRRECSDYLVKNSKKQANKFKPIDCHFHDVEDSIVTVTITTHKSALPRGVTVNFFRDDNKNETWAKIMLASNEIAKVGPFIAKNRNELAYAVTHLLNKDNYFHRLEINEKYQAPKNKEQIMIIIDEVKKQLDEIKHEVEKNIRDIIVEIKPAVMEVIEDEKLSAMYTEDDLSLSKALKEFGYVAQKNTHIE